MTILAVLLPLMLVASACATDGSSAAATGENALEDSQTSSTAGDLTVTSEVESTTTTTEPEINRAELLLAEMTVEEKVGQLFMPVVWGSDATTVTEIEGRRNQEIYGYSTPAEIVAAYRLGGVMYLRTNIIGADQLGTFSAGLQEASRAETGIGMLIAVDQEGGRVNRITDGVTVFPPAALLSGDSQAVEEAGYLTGRQVAAQGVNVVLAPVADINEPGADGAIGNRSYGDDPQIVAEMVRASVGGLQEAGVAAAVKHWPGHGATDEDSHFQLPELEISRDAWEGRERVPFQAAIETDVAMVMVGHLVLASVDPGGDPATVSSVLIEDELRGVLGFDGVVITDALNMQAVDGIEQSDLMVQSLVAGADILLQPEELATAYPAVVTAVASGELPEDRLDAAVLRVLRLKERLGLLPPVAS